MDPRSIANASDMRIRLVAIAKNEAAYLPEWIFHHRFFGFEDIEVLVNQTTDNTDDLIAQLALLSGVRFRFVDHLLDQSEHLPFQIAAYKEAFLRARGDGVTHILFLDIDEFWTPADFVTTIAQFLANHATANVLCFPWLVPHEDKEPFSPAFAASQRLQHNAHVKSLVATHSPISRFGVHVPDISDPNAKFIMSDGREIGPNPGPKPLTLEQYSGIPAAFILHRMWRSPLEYLYRLGEGMRQAFRAGEDTPPIKTNRRGYGKAHHQRTELFSIAESEIHTYERKRDTFMALYELGPILGSAKRRVVERVPAVVKTLNQLRKVDPDQVNLLLNRLNADLLLEEPDIWLRANFGTQTRANT